MFRFVKQISGSQDPLICFFFCVFYRATVGLQKSRKTGFLSNETYRFIIKWCRKRHCGDEEKPFLTNVVHFRITHKEK